MKIKFYGTRGSTPVSGPEYSEFGGNTTCVRLTLGNGAEVLLDAGSGARKLGQDLLDEGKKPPVLAIVLSHTHWDHIQGFPFFAPAYIPGNKIIIGICGRDRIGKGDLRSIFAAQMQDDFFPVPLDKMGAEFEFLQPDADSATGPLGNTVKFIKHNHPGGAYSYRIEADGKSLVYSTDVEHGDALDERLIRFADGADALIHDGQYTSEELAVKKGWGHSSWEQAVEAAERAGVGSLFITHHDPEHDDAFLRKVEEDARARFAEACLARDGMEAVL